MDEQVRKLEAIFKQRKNSQDEDDGDNNSFGEYWKFQEPNKVEYWSIELDRMTSRTYFVHKFKNSTVPFPISNNEYVKDVLFEKGGTILIHCMTIIDDLYMFTICVDYSIYLFDLPIFLKNLENSD